MQIRLATLVYGTLASLLFLHSEAQPHTTANATPLRGAAEAFVASLSSAQKTSALHAFDDRERKHWDYWPGTHEGVEYQSLNKDQRALVDRLLQLSLSERGLDKLSLVRELEVFNPYHSPHYFIAIFGEPGPTNVWGWRYQGHHVSLNFSLSGDHLESFAPAFLGTQPLSSPKIRRGAEPLKSEKALALALFDSFDAAQRRQAQISRAWGYLPRRSDHLDREKPRGLPADRLTDEQYQTLAELISVYLDLAEPELAKTKRTQALATPKGSLHFGFSGSPDDDHYYLIQGEFFQIEYDCRDNGEHIHCVWREFDHDFGGDVLQQHIEKDHR